MPDLWFFPIQASEAAGSVDTLYVGLLWLTAFFMVGIAGAILLFLVRYRRGSRAERVNVRGSLSLELTWIVIPTLLAIGIFVWSMTIYLSLQAIPQSGMDIYVVGKQWMWKFQYSNGQREINSLHVPAGETVRLRMTSQDVIHSLYLPAMRVKQDVLPGRFTTLSFEATEPGTYHLFCAEYCGTDHSEMRGTVTVMEPAGFEEWIAGDRAEQPPDLASAGEQLFDEQGCANCHAEEATIEAPDLAGLYDSEVRLESGETVVADENYLRTSILQPQEQIVAGYEPLMPSFQGQLSEGEVIELIEYIKSLSDQESSEPSSPEAEQPDDE